MIKKAKRLLFVSAVACAAIPCLVSTGAVMNAHAEITDDEATKLLEGLNLSKDFECATMGQGVKKIFKNTPEFKGLISENSTELPNSWTRYVSGWSLSDVTNKINTQFGLNADLDVKVNPANVNLSGSLSFSKEQAESLTNVKENYYELSRTYIQTKVTTVDWDNIDAASYFSDSFKNAYNSLATLSDAISFINDFGSHVFGQYYFGGIMNITEHIASNTSILADCQAEQKQYSLKASITNAVSANAAGENGSVVQSQINSSNTKTDNDISTFGGNPPPANNVEDLYTFKQEYASQYESGFLYSAWMKSVSKGEKNIVCNVGYPYSIWNLIHGSSIADSNKENLLKKAFTINSYLNYLKGCSNLNINDNFIENIEYKVNDNNFAFKPEGSSIVLPDNISTAFKLNYEFFGIDESAISMKISDTYSSVASVVDDKVVIATNAIGKKFVIDFYAYDTKIKSLTVDVKKANLSYFAGGYGTQGQPYLIATKSQLSAFMTQPECYSSSNYFKLISDISLKDGASSISPIGSDNTPFNADLDGNGHIISDFNIKASESQNNGFIRANYGTIKNLTLKNVHLISEGILSSTLNEINAGIVCGANRGLIENVEVLDSSIYFIGSKVSNDIDMNVGGICGLNEKDIKFTRAVSTYVCAGSDNKGVNVNVGGLVGKSTKGFINHCYIRESSLRISSDKEGSVFAGLIFGNIKKESCALYCMSYLNKTERVIGNSHSFGNIAGIADSESMFVLCIFEGTENVAVNNKEYQNCNCVYKLVFNEINDEIVNAYWVSDENNRPILKSEIVED